MIPQNLATVIQAANQVSPNIVTNCRSVSHDTEIKYVNERSFAYELYRQWQNKLAAYMTKDILLYHPFKMGVFILVGGDLSYISNIKEEITVDNQIMAKKDNLFCMFYNVKIVSTPFHITNSECTENQPCRKLLFSTRFKGQTPLIQCSERTYYPEITCMSLREIIEINDKT